MTIPLPDPEWYLENVLADYEPGEDGGPASRVVPGQAGQWQRWWTVRAHETDPLVRAAAERGFVLTTADLAQLGVGRSAVRTALRRGRWFSPGPGFVTPLDLSDDDPFVTERRRHAVAAAAAVLDRPGQNVSGRSAAVLHGLPVLSVPERAEVTVAGRANLGNAVGGHRYGASLAAAETTSWFGIAVTEIARTVVDVARHDRRSGLMAADAALHERLTGTPALRAAVDRAQGWPGVRTARLVVMLADGRSESPLESLVRLRLHDDGFPPPELQWPIGGYRADLAWPDRRLVLEADGRRKYVADANWREKQREQVLRRLGWQVERVVWADVRQGWPAVRAALARYF